MAAKRRTGTVRGLVFLLFLAVGCQGSNNPKTWPVTGKVTYRGEPVTSGMIMLTPVDGGHAATGNLDQDGSFRLTTFQKDDGAVAGSYQVAIQVFPAEGAGLPGAEFAGKAPPIPRKYASPASSGLTAEIKPRENALDFPLPK